MSGDALYRAIVSDLPTALKEAGIFVRYFSKPERISNYLRITIGTDDEMEQLFLKEVNR